MNNSFKHRWIYRFDNFKRAFVLLEEAVNLVKERKITQLEQEGIIKRFEYIWELTWKTLKDYLEHKGVIIETITPASVIRESVSANLIKNGEILMNALDSRNKMSHTYDVKKLEQIITDIEKHYYPELKSMYLTMLKLENEEKIITD